MKPLSKASTAALLAYTLSVTPSCAFLKVATDYGCSKIPTSDERRACRQGAKEIGKHANVFQL